VFGLDLAALARLTRNDQPGVHRLPNGLTVWLGARMHSNDGAGPLVSLGASNPPASPSIGAPGASRPTAPTLRDNDRHLIRQTVEACGGNVSKAARALGVSRGLIYRHLRASAPQ
jgi:transcriptional regulator of acetoin/glycerol metabolism